VNSPFTRSRSVAPSRSMRAPSDIIAASVRWTISEMRQLP
jgi:hypothetical protein